MRWLLIWMAWMFPGSRQQDALDFRRLTGLGQPSCEPVLSPAHPAPELSTVFAETCAGCHGADGAGQGIYPSLTAIPSAAAFEASVRAGVPRVGGMPAFSHERYPSTLALQDFAALTGQGITVEAGCTPFVADSPTYVPPGDATVRAAGLAAWRLPDHEGAACANCHGPAPFDIASLDYRDGDILRRAMLHVDSETSWQLVDWVDLLRADQGLDDSSLPDPMDYRPLQPGGYVLPGATPADRDHAFGQQLATLVPTLAGPPIRDLTTAQQALTEFLAVEPRTLPTGIVFNRYTEDEHHGVEHATLREWLPDHAIQPVDDAARATIYATHDAWLAEPSFANFQAMEAVIDTYDGDDGGSLTHLPTAPGDATEPGRLARHQHRSVLFLQHLFRTAGSADVAAAFSAYPSTVGMLINGPWRAADELRTHSDSCWYDPACGDEYDPVMASKLDFTGKVDWRGDAWDLQAEKEDFILPWFWTGFLVDQGMESTCCGNSTRSTEYLTARLYERDMYNHLTFVRVRKVLALGLLESWNDDDPQTLASRRAQNWGYFLGYGRGMGNKTPDDPDARDLYRTLTANALRMLMIELNDHLTVQGWAVGVQHRDHQDEDNYGLRALADSFAPLFADIHGESMEDPTVLTGEAQLDAQLLSDLRDLLHDACEAGDPGYQTAPWPGHCDH